MSYNIMRTGKINSRKKITEAGAHNFRTRHQGNIDATKTPENKILWNPLEVNTAVASDLQKRLTSHYEALGVKERADSVLMQEFVVSASPSFFEGLPSDKVQEWAADQLEFMKIHFGENVKMAVLHLDEKTPHLHFLLSCEQKTLKRYKNRHGECSKETWSLNAKRWGPEFLKDLHTKHAEHNQKWGLKRGEPRSEAKHKPLKEHYAELAKKEAEMERAILADQKKTELLGKARNYIEAARTTINEQLNQIIELIDIATGYDLTPEDQARVNEIADGAFKSMGGKPPKPPKQNGVGGG
jgi:uncharacterized protein YnzC (UPF0291/DUF896 family)